MSNQIQREVFKAKYRDLVPANAKAVIVAQLHQDQSDIMSDYFAHSVEKTIILGFSTHTRDLFSEMRKFAALAPETAHLAGELWDAHVVLAADKHHGPAPYYHEGQRSHWHRDEEPETPFRSEAEARAWADAHPLLPMSMDGVEIPFRWALTLRDVEHREKYSMGGGYYLMDGWRHGSGWCVKKIRLYGADPMDSIPIGRWIGVESAKAAKGVAA